MKSVISRSNFLDAPVPKSLSTVSVIISYPFLMMITPPKSPMYASMLRCVNLNTTTDISTMDVDIQSLFESTDVAINKSESIFLEIL